MSWLATVAATVGVSWVLAGCAGGSAPAASDLQPPAPVPPAAVVSESPAPIAPQPTASPVPTALAAPAVSPTPSTAAVPTPRSVPAPGPTSIARPVPTRPTSAGRLPRPASPAAVPRAHTTPTKPDTADVVTARPGTHNPKPARWERVEVLSQRKLRVHFTSAMAPCRVLDSVRVDYRPTTVVVTLYTGSDPKRTDRVCAAVAREKAVDVRLAKPLAGRTVVDGAAVPSAAPGQSRTGALEVHPTPGAVATRPTAWDSSEVIGERTVRIYFTSGTAPCSVLDRVRVDYAADRVTITLITGRHRAAVGQACTMALRPAYVDVKLSEPLAGRRIVDGA